MTHDVQQLQKVCVHMIHSRPPPTDHELIITPGRERIQGNLLWCQGGQEELFGSDSQRSSKWY